MIAPTEHRPPVGVIPREVHRRKRFNNLHRAMAEYHEAGIPVPQEWIAEYVDLMYELAPKVVQDMYDDESQAD